MKKLLFSALVAGLVIGPFSAFADTTYSYPNEADKSGLSVTFPDGWKAEPDSTDAKGLIVKSPDGDVEFDLWAIESSANKEELMDEMKANAEEVAQLVKDNISGFQVTSRAKGDVNGLHLALFEGKGKNKDDGSEATVTVMFATPNDGQIFGIMYWGSEAAEKKYSAELDKIAKSIKKK